MNPCDGQIEEFGCQRKPGGPREPCAEKQKAVPAIVFAKPLM